MSSAPSSQQDGAAAASAAALSSLCSAYVQGPPTAVVSESTTSVAPPVDEAAAATAISQLMLMVHGRRATLKDVVVACGAYLTSPHAAHRRRGVLLLAELLARLPKMQLDDKATHTLVVFFTGRLQDEDCWKETLLGVSSLVHHRSLTAPELTLICRAIFDHVPVQSLTQSGRKMALDSLYRISQTQPGVLSDLGDYTISGLLRCIDGEKDPRNLLITFRLAAFLLSGTVAQASGGSRVAFSTAMLKPYVEEVFEMTSCYFPITFHPPKDDPIGITGADLQLALRQVFAAHSALSEYVIPMLLEKLDSSVIECKLDALDTLRFCLQSGAYGIPQWDPFLDALQTALKKEMFHGGTEHDGVITAASTTFSSLIALLCPDQVGGFSAGHLAPSWGLLMGPLLDEVATELKAPDSKLARSYATLLQLICATSVNAFTRCMNQLFRTDIEGRFYAGDVQPSQRVAILELLSLLVAAANQSFTFALPQHPLQPYAESCVTMMMSVLVDGSAEQRAIALKGMAAIAALAPFTLAPPSTTNQVEASTTDMDVDHVAAPTSATSSVQQRLLPLDQVQSLVQTLTDRLQTDADEYVRHECLCGLVKLSRDPLYGALVLEFTLPALFNPRTMALMPTSSTEVPIESSEMSDLDRMVAAPRVADLDDVLAAASELCRSSALLAATLPHLIRMMHSHFAGVLEGAPESVQAMHMVLDCLGEIVASHGSGEDARTRLECCVTTLPQSLIGMLVHGSLLNAQADPLRALDAKTIASAVGILQTIVRAADVTAQQALVDSTLSLFLDGNVATFAQPDLLAPNDVAFTPLVSTNLARHTTTSQLQLLPLFTAVVGSIRSGVSVPRLAEVIQRLTWFIDAHSDAAASDARQSAIECLAAVVNKLPLADPLLAEVEQQLAKRIDQIHDHALVMPQRHLAAAIAIWLTKALVMRGHPRGAQFAEKLIQSLALYSSAPTLAETLARGMNVILRDCTTVLNREAHANCGAGQLYKQRFFVQNLPLLLSLFAASSPSSDADSSSPRFVILLALAHLLKHVPHAVIMASLQTLMPLLLQSLTHPESELRVATLDTVAVLLSTDVQCMARHLNTLVPVLLDLMRFQAATRVRLTSLECLSYLRALPYASMHPFRANILATLAASVDDHKRVVRQAAAKARNAMLTTE